MGKDLEFRAYLKLHFIVLIWGGTAILGKLMTISSVGVVLYRTAIASLGIFLIILFRNIEFRLEKKEALKILGTGTLIALHWITFFWSARLANVSVCLAGIATASFWTSLIDPLINHRRIKWYESFLSLVSVLGISLVFQSSWDQYYGLLVAMLSAVFASVFTVINGRLIKRHHHYTISMYEMTGAFIMTLILMPFVMYFGERDFFGLIEMQDLDWLYLLVLSIICTVFAYSIGVQVMKQLAPFAVNLTINLEPVYGIGMALIIFGENEKMSSGFYFGTILVILSVLFYPLLKRMDGNGFFKNIH